MLWGSCAPCRALPKTAALDVVDWKYGHLVKFSFLVDGAASRPKRDQSARKDEPFIFKSGGGASAREKPAPKKVARAKPPRPSAHEAPKLADSPSPARGYSSEEVLAKRAKEWVDGRRNDRWQTCVRVVFSVGGMWRPVMRNNLPSVGESALHPAPTSSLRT